MLRQHRPQTPAYGALCQVPEPAALVALRAPPARDMDFLRNTSKTSKKHMPPAQEPSKSMRLRAPERLSAYLDYSLDPVPAPLDPPVPPSLIFLTAAPAWPALPDPNRPPAMNTW
jgi:hypothetical protein